MVLGKKEKIMIAESNIIMRQRLWFLLSATAADVSAAGTTDEASPLMVAEVVLVSKEVQAVGLDA